MSYLVIHTRSKYLGESSPGYTVDVKVPVLTVYAKFREAYEYAVANSGFVVETVEAAVTPRPRKRAKE